MCYFKIVLFIFLCVGMGCSQSNNTGLVLPIDSIKNINPKESKSLEELGWQIDYIPLETRDEVLIKEIDQLVETENFFWIVTQNNHSIYKFDKKGSFISSIEKQGEGPEEYISVAKIQVNESMNELFIMDYFGRKMVVTDLEGNFLRSFKLPEDYAFNSFYLFKDDIYYTSVCNAVSPDLLKYNSQTNRTVTISKRNRVMGAEGFMGETYLYELNDNLYLFHYFNDTVFQVKEHLLPVYEVRTGRLKFTFEQLEMDENFNPKIRPDGPKLQLRDFYETPQYVFLFYTISEYKGESMKPFMGVYDKQEDVFYPHLNIVSKSKPFLSLENGKHFSYSSVSNSLFTTQEALEEEHNPVIIQYSLHANTIY